MTQTADIFDALLSNLAVDTTDNIATRRDEITKALNSEFRDLDGSTANKLMVGSYGRVTAIKGISDLDLLYILPSSLNADYHSAGGPRKALQRSRDAIAKRYSNTIVRVDRLVVVVEFSNFMFEVQPVFENDDTTYDYPDTYSDSWKVTKPRDEIAATKEMNNTTFGNLRRLCKLTRAWRNKHGVVMGGLLVDTLAYNYLTSHDTHRNSKSELYGEMMRDFLRYLADEEDHDFYAALGSRQRVKVKKRFQRSAASGADLCDEAISAAGTKGEFKKWRAVFGKASPAEPATETALTAAAFPVGSFTDTEQFIEDHYAVDIRHGLDITCVVTQDGFRPIPLTQYLIKYRRLPPKKTLRFTIDYTDAPLPYEVRWKVLNRGSEAERRDQIRGDIIRGNHAGGNERREPTAFRGDHYVECYVIRHGIVVARAHLYVPIEAAS
jgi:hypothetical protein